MAEWNAPFWAPSGDLKVIFTMASATDNPEAFSNDPVYSDPRHYSFYTPGFVAGVRLFQRLTGSHAAFCRFFSPVLLVLQLVGFYLLGRALFGNRWAGLALAILSLCYVNLPRGTYVGWRGYRYVSPRTFLMSLAPFVFWFALHFRKRPWAWFLAMALLGVLAYIHPVSAPVLALGLWASFFAFHPAEWSWRRRLGTALACGAVFLIAVLPFALWYRAHVQLGSAPPEGLSQDQALALMNARVADIAGVWRAFTQTCLAWLRFPLVVVLCLSCVGAILGILHCSTRKVVVICLLWLAGIWGASFLVPALDEVLSGMTGRLPSQISLARGMRYFSWPLMALMLLLPRAGAKFAERWSCRVKLSTWLHRGALILTVTGMLCMLGSRPPQGIGQLVRKQWCKGRLVPRASKQQADLKAAFEAIKERTAPGTRLISESEEAAMVARYYCLRPLAHTRKDGGLLLYTDVEAMSAWAANEKRWQAACAEAKEERTILPLTAVARELKADYLLTRHDRASDVSELPQKGFRIVYSNDSWLLLELSPEAGNR